MDSVDRLVACLEFLQKLLILKRRLLQKDCQQLEILLKPWPLEDKSAKRENTNAADSQKSPNATSSDQSRPARIDKSDADIEQEMAKADKLLEKIQRLRCTVNDQEVRGLCNIKDSHSQDRSTNPIKTKSSSQPLMSKKVPSKKVIGEVARKSTAVNPRQAVSTKTTYTASYKAPRLPASARKSCRVRTEAAATTVKTTTTLTSNSAGIQNNGQTRVTTETSQRDILVNDGPGIGMPENGSGDRNGQPTTFTLQQQGHQLKVPRSMKNLAKLNTKLRSTLESRNRQHTIPGRLTSYFCSIEQPGHSDYVLLNDSNS